MVTVIIRPQQAGFRLITANHIGQQSISSTAVWSCDHMMQGGLAKNRGVYRCIFLSVYYIDVWNPYARSEAHSLARQVSFTSRRRSKSGNNQIALACNTHTHKHIIIKPLNYNKRKRIIHRIRTRMPAGFWVFGFFFFWVFFFWIIMMAISNRSVEPIKGLKACNNHNKIWNDHLIIMPWWF